MTWNDLAKVESETENPHGKPLMPRLPMLVFCKNLEHMQLWMSQIQNSLLLLPIGKFKIIIMETNLRVLKVNFSS